MLYTRPQSARHYDNPKHHGPIVVQ